MLKKGFYILLFSLFINTYSQQYPKWFLEPGKIKGFEYSIGYSNPSTIERSPVSGAYQNACQYYAQYKWVNIEADQLFWSTEGGVYAISKLVTETYDKELINTAQQNFTTIDSLRTANIELAFIAESSIKLIDELKELINIDSLNIPFWIESVPQHSDFIYSVGKAPGYYYESSSWLEAEKAAVLSVARQLSILINSIQLKSEIEAQEKSKMRSSVTISDIRVISRYYDKKNNVYYVLNRIHK